MGGESFVARCANGRRLPTSILTRSRSGELDEAREDSVSLWPRRVQPNRHRSCVQSNENSIGGVTLALRRALQLEPILAVERKAPLRLLYLRGQKEPFTS
jgi:hypothetical protein